MLHFYADNGNVYKKLMFRFAVWEGPSSAYFSSRLTNELRSSEASQPRTDLGRTWKFLWPILPFRCLPSAKLTTRRSPPLRILSSVRKNSIRTAINHEATTLWLARAGCWLPGSRPYTAIRPPTFSCEYCRLPIMPQWGLVPVHYNRRYLQPINYSNSQTAQKESPFAYLLSNPFSHFRASCSPVLQIALPPESRYVFRIRMTVMATEFFLRKQLIPQMSGKSLIRLYNTAYLS